VSVLDIDERIEQADKQADLYLRWKAEDDEFQKKQPNSLIYSWFAEHSRTWRPEPNIEDNPLEEHELTPLEKEYGQPHITYGPGRPLFAVYFYCLAEHRVDITTPGLPLDKSKVPPLYTLASFYSTVQLKQVNTTISLPDGTQLKSDLRFPPIIALKNVSEWPDWLIDSRNCRCRQPWNNVTFWVEDSCNTVPINHLIYQPSISQGEPTEYNFFRPLDYFLVF
jgi:hypothetical protein